MNNKQFSPNAISHKDLNVLLNKAKKEISSTDTPEIRENQELNDLLTTWTETSKKILLMLKDQNQIITKNRNPKSLMAFGAMGAHINMALQALKAADSDQ